jgi:hypothetical protein
METIMNSTALKQKNRSSGTFVPNHKKDKERLKQIGSGTESFDVYQHIEHVYKQFRGHEVADFVLEIIHSDPIRALEIETKCSDEAVMTTREFTIDYFLRNYIRKFPDFRNHAVYKDRDKEFKSAPKLKAMEAFTLAERECMKTNVRLATLFTSGEVESSTKRVSNVLHRAKSIISNLLYIDDCFFYDELQAGCRWSGGSTTSVTRQNAADVTYKVREHTISTSTTAKDHFCRAVKNDYAWLQANPQKFEIIDGNVVISDSAFNLVNHNNIITVPKNAKTDRTIAIEPSANIFLQLGVGSFIRNRLLRAGIDLRKQSNNQRAASLCHKNGQMTVDLSAASDTISSSLVEFLLPDDLLLYMADLRSVNYKLTSSEGETTITPYKKWSSMGNGYTFELESTIFYALTRAVQEQLELEGEVTFTTKSILVYGDDIICDRANYDFLKEVFTVCGFKINLEKTFSKGLFFESCGKHYYNGHDVSPIFLFHSVVSSHDIMLCYNTLMRFAMRTSDGGRFVYSPHEITYHYLDRSFIQCASYARHIAMKNEIFNKYVTTFYDEDNDGFVHQSTQIREVCIEMYDISLDPTKLYRLSLKSLRTKSLFLTSCKIKSSIVIPEQASLPGFETGGKTLPVLESLSFYGSGYFALNKLTKTKDVCDTEHTQALLAYVLRLRTHTPFNGKVGTGRPPRNRVNTIYRWVGVDIPVFN